jgi:hypothetical protein
MKTYSITNTILLIITLLVISLGLIAFTNKYILTVNFYDKNAQPVSGIPELESVVYQNIQRTIYIYSVICQVVKITLISLIIFTGLYYTEIKTPLRNVFRIVVLAEFIFFIPAIVKVWRFYYYCTDASLQQWQQYYFLSAASLTEYVKPVFLYPFQTFNAFELGYWFLLAAGIRSITGVNFDRALRVVLFSYVPALLIWVVVVVFFTMVYFPQAY